MAQIHVKLCALLVGAAGALGVALALDNTGVCTHARVGLGAVAPTPLLVDAAAKALIGTRVDDAVELIRKEPVDLVLLDINLGAEQGGAFLARARAVGYTGKVLVVTAGVGDREAAWRSLARRHIAGNGPRRRGQSREWPDRTRSSPG